MISKRVHEREIWFLSDFYTILYVIYYVILMSERSLSKLIGVILLLRSIWSRSVISKEHWFSFTVVFHFKDFSIYLEILGTGTLKFTVKFDGLLIVVDKTIKMETDYKAEKRRYIPEAQS